MPRKNFYDLKDKKNIQRTRTVSLIVTSNCNLSCTYCYEKHELRDKKIMSSSVAKSAITHYLNEKGYDLVTFDFFGGEPFLGFPFIREVVEWTKIRTWNIKHGFFISTNGTILDDNIKKWLYENREYVYVGVSVDGIKKAHDISRSGSYDTVIKNLPFFMKNWPKQPAKMTICSETIPYIADSIIHLEELGLFFTANMSFEDQWGDQIQKAKLLELYEEQLAILVDYYTTHPYLYPVAPLLTSVPDYLGFPSSESKPEKQIKRFCGAGHEMVVIDMDGTKYPCHRFVPWVSGKTLPLENINCQSEWKPDSCAECKLIHSCPTCAGFNWELNNNTGIRTSFHCDSFKIEVKAACLLALKRLEHKMNRWDSVPDEEKANILLRFNALEKYLSSE